MKLRLFVTIAIVVCLTIMVCLILSWKASWTGGNSLAWLLVSTTLSVLCVIAATLIIIKEYDPFAFLDKFIAALVAIGFLWVLWVAIWGWKDTDAKRAGMIVDIKDGFAYVSFSPYRDDPGKSFLYRFPATGNFYRLKKGDPTDVLWAKHPMLAIEKRGFVILSSINSAVLIFGGLFAGGRFRLKFGKSNISLDENKFGLG